MVSAVRLLDKARTHPGDMLFAGLVATLLAVCGALLVETLRPVAAGPAPASVSGPATFRWSLVTTRSVRSGRSPCPGAGGGSWWGHGRRQGAGGGGMCARRGTSLGTPRSRCGAGRSRAARIGEMATWFTSDLHLGHRNILRLANRPFSSLEEMHEHLVAAWNDRVRPGDTVYDLGDLVFGSPARAATVLERLNGQHHWIVGNHDPDERSRSKLAHLFASISEYREVRLDGRLMVLFHYPIASWHGAGRGAIHLHGHCHGSLVLDSQPRLDVGVDARGRLAGLGYAPGLLRGGPGDRRSRGTPLQRSRRAPGRAGVAVSA